MPRLVVCRLCVNECTAFKCLYSANGLGNELHRLIVKYFHPETVNMDESKHLTVICTQCFRCIYDFHSFQTLVSVAQLKLLDDHYVECIKIDPEEIVMEQNNPHVPSCSMVMEQDSSAESQTMVGQQNSTPELQAMIGEQLLDDHYVECIKIDPEEIVMEQNNPHVPSCSMVMEQDSSAESQTMVGQQNSTPELQAMIGEQETAAEYQTVQEQIINNGQLSTNKAETASTTWIRGEQLGSTIGLNVIQIESFGSLVPNGPITAAADTICTMVHVSTDIKRETTIDRLAVDDASSESDSASIENDDSSGSNLENDEPCHPNISNDESAITEDIPKESAAIEDLSHCHQTNEADNNENETETALKATPSAEISQKNIKTYPKRSRTYYKADRTPNKVNISLNEEEDIEYDEIKKTFNCKLCGYCSIAKRHITRHISRRHRISPGDISLPNCSLLSENISDIKDNRSRFKCNQCPCSYITATSLRRHQRKLHPEVTTPSRELQKNIKPEQEFVCDKSKDMFKCNLCDCLYSFNCNFVKHMRRVHGKVLAAPDTESSECQQCGKVFRSNKERQRHFVRIHEPSGSYSCQKCGKAFTKYSYYTYHVRHSHNEPLSYKCSICGKTFNRPAKLQMHRISHTNEPQSRYLCPFCPKSFKYSHSLRHHQKRAHPMETKKADRSKKKTFVSGVDTQMSLMEE